MRVGCHLDLSTSHSKRRAGGANGFICLGSPVDLPSCRTEQSSSNISSLRPLETDPRMPNITDPPPKFIAFVLGTLENIRSLPPALLACRRFRTPYQENPGLARGILRRQVGDALLPYAIATHSLTEFKGFSSSVEVAEVIQTLHEAPSKLLEQVKKFSLSDLASIGRRHDVVEDLALMFGKGAWLLLS